MNRVLNLSAAGYAVGMHSNSKVNTGSTLSRKQFVTVRQS